MVSDKGYEALRELVRADDSAQLVRVLDRPASRELVLDGLLADAVEHEASHCLRILIDRAPSATAAAEAAGIAAARGDTESLRALINAGADFAYPEWEPDSDVDHVLRGAMLSMQPEIVDLACSAGAVDRAAADWINEAIEIGVASRKKAAIACLSHLGAAVADRLDRDKSTVLEAGVLDRLAKKLGRKSVSPSGQEAGRRLRQFVDTEAALRDKLIDLVVYGRHFDRVFEELASLPQAKADELAAVLIPWVARKARPSSRFGSGWWALERLLDERESDVDRRDDFDRTALMHVVWRTQDRHDLIERLVARGADVNAVQVDDMGRHRSVLDHAGLNREKHLYVQRLRDLGALTYKELAKAGPKHPSDTL